MDFYFFIVPINSNISTHRNCKDRGSENTLLFWSVDPLFVDGCSYGDLKLYLDESKDWLNELFNEFNTGKCLWQFPTAQLDLTVIDVPLSLSYVSIGFYHVRGGFKYFLFHSDYYYFPVSCHRCLVNKCWAGFSILQNKSTNRCVKGTRTCLCVERMIHQQNSNQWKYSVSSTEESSKSSPSKDLFG